MKPIEPLIESIYDSLTSNPALVSLLGSFTDTNSDETPLAIAYGTLPENYRTPNTDKIYLVYNIEFSNPKPNQGKSFLQEVSLKFYIGGYDALRVVDILVGQFNNTQIYNYVISPKGTVQLPSGDITLRFNLI